MVRSALLALGAVLFLALFVLPASAQDSVVGLWVSEDGAITFHLTQENSYELSGPLAFEERLLTGRYAVPGDSGQIIIRANERQGAIRFEIVEIENARLVLASDEAFGGSVAFSRPAAVFVAIDRALSGYALFWLVIMAGGAIMTGQALGRSWQPFWKTIPYAALIGLADVCPSLFDGRLIHTLDSVMLFTIHTPIIFVVMIISYFGTKASRMVAQYPWRYERAGAFGWREKKGG